MCIVCYLYQKELLTAKEAKKACWEMVLDEKTDEKHLQKLYAELEEAEKLEDEVLV